METSDLSKYKEYKKWRNKTRSMVRKIKKNEERDVAMQSKEKPKKFWSFVKSKLNTVTRVADLKFEGEGNRLATSDEERAEVLSTFFTKVFTIEPVGELPSVSESNIQVPLEDIRITEDVLKKLEQLKVDKSPGPDNVNARILKELKDSLSEVLTDIYKLPIKEGKLPEDWKSANISAIFKKGNKSEVSNYRPVSHLHHL